jgi:hypothetical protein
VFVSEDIDAIPGEITIQSTIAEQPCEQLKVIGVPAKPGLHRILFRLRTKMGSQDFINVEQFVAVTTMISSDTDCTQGGDSGSENLRPWNDFTTTTITTTTTTTTTTTSTTTTVTTTTTTNTDTTTTTTYTGTTTTLTTTTYTGTTITTPSTTTHTTTTVSTTTISTTGTTTGTGSITNPPLANPPTPSGSDGEEVEIDLDHETEEETEGYVEFGDSPEEVDANQTPVQSTKTAGKFFIKVGEAGYPPGTTVYYRLRIRIVGTEEFGYGPIYSFVISRASDDETPFAFIIGMDTRSNSTNQTSSDDFKDNFWPDVGIVTERSEE